MNIDKYLLAIAVTLTLSVCYAQNDDARFIDDGNLIRPQDCREWVIEGTAATPKIANRDVLFPDFRNIYIDPDTVDNWSYF